MSVCVCVCVCVCVVCVCVCVSVCVVSVCACVCVCVYVCVCNPPAKCTTEFLLIITCIVKRQRTRRSKRSSVVQLHIGTGFVFQTPWQLASRQRRTGSCRCMPASATSARAT